jgi:hypothetical protein
MSILTFKRVIIILVAVSICWLVWVRVFDATTVSSTPKQTQKFVKQSYTDLPIVDKINKTIVSIDTTGLPTDAMSLQPLLKSLSNQSTRVNQICLNLLDTDAEKYMVNPSILKGVTVSDTPTDYGYALPYTPCILREEENDTKIIVVKSNIVLDRNAISRIVQSSNDNPHLGIIDNNGAILVKPSFFSSKNIIGHSSSNNPDWLKDNIDVGFIYI